MVRSRWRGKNDVCVFDARHEINPNPETRVGLAGIVSTDFRRTEADRKPARKNVTREIMGDPLPGRTPWAAK